MSTSASVKIAKVKQRKMILIAVAIIVIVVASLVAYVVLFSYNNSTDHFQLSLESTTTPTQIERGSQIEVLVMVNFNPKDHITLTTSGNGASWANFVQNVQNGQQFLSQITITAGENNVDLLVKVPSDAQISAPSIGNSQIGIAGGLITYSIVITGTNSAGITSSVTYNFTLT
jgi:uncharacterized protein YpuA (DUF1002 family)